MPLPGGPADKFGNRYEGRWTLACMLDVMDERADSIRLEPPGLDGEEAEFWVRKGDVREYHQVKRQHSSGRWMLQDLDKVGVLAHFSDKLSDHHSYCVFVSIHAAFQLEELADRARRATSWDEFDREFLRADVHRKNFDSLCQAFGNLPRPEVYQYLKGIKVETVSENYLQSTVGSRLWTLVEGDPLTVADVLAEFALEKVNHELTAPQIWHHLETRGFRRRPLDNDPHTLSAVEHANNRYLSALRNQAISGHVLPRDEVHAVLNLLASSDGKRGVMLTGEAGVGKSGVMLQVVEELLYRGVPTLAFRVDRLQPTQLPDNVGEQRGLHGSPANVLAAVAQGKDYVLVIDQLDALSLALGRNAEVFDCIDEIIRQTQAHSNVHILLACRKFDLDNDFRLRRFTGSDGFVDTVTVNRLSDQTVREVVSGFGLDASRLDARRLSLLSVPLHLKLLSEIANDSTVDALNFATVQDLYEHFWRYKQRVIEHERLGRSVQWTRVIYALCDYMHEHQRLTGPEVLVQEWSNDADAMASENVLVFGNNQYAFFHEGFFDYAYARRFASGSQKLLALLLSDEQHIFRRAQVRQILLYLRETDFGRYIEDLADVVTSCDVRFHIKQVVFALLAELTSPNRKEWELLSQLLNRDPDDPSRRHTWSMIRNSMSWFELVDSLGCVEKWLADPSEELADQTMWLLSGVQRKAADRVAELVEPYIGTSKRWKNRLSYLAQWADLSLGRRFMDLFLRLLDEGILDEARGPVAVNSDFWDLLYSLATQRPGWTSEAIGHYLNRRLMLSLAAGQPNPFDSQSGTIQDSQVDDHVLAESARGAPADFIREILPFMLQVMDLTAERMEDEPWPDAVWGYRFYHGGHGVEHALLKAMEVALSELATWEPSNFVNAVGSLRDGFVA
jgi:hypothetical protein